MSTDTIPAKKTWYEILIALTPLIVGIGVTGVGAYFTQVNNDRQLQMNELNALDKLRPMLMSENPLDREFAYASFVALGHEQLALKLMRLKKDSAGREVAARIQASSDSSDDTRTAAAAVVKSIPVQVFVHIAAEDQRPHAAALIQALESEGYSVPGIENIAGKATLPKRTNVRYFNPQDKATADSIAGILRKQGIDDAYPYAVTHLNARPGSLEIWFAAPAVSKPVSAPLSGQASALKPASSSKTGVR
jgi:hypothetical protein